MTAPDKLLSFTRAPSQAEQSVRDGVSLCLLRRAALAQLMFEYNAKLVRLIDGDTMILDVDCGFNITVRERFRLSRVNAPELMSISGMQARTFVALQLQKATALKISSEKSRQEKFGRWLCELYFQTAETGDHWQSLNQLLLDTNHAVPMKH